MTITLRNTKGSSLTYAELDGNFTDLNVRLTDAEFRGANGWKDLVTPLVIPLGSGAPILTSWRDGIWLPQFAPNEIQSCMSSAHLGHDYLNDTMIYPHMHWTIGVQAAVGVVRWGFAYTWARRNDSTGQTAFPVEQTIYIETTVNKGDHSHYVSESADGLGIPGIGMEPDTLLLFSIFRDGTHVNDTYVDPIYGFSFDIHYQCDKDATPLRRPPFY